MTFRLAQALTPVVALLIVNSPTLAQTVTDRSKAFIESMAALEATNGGRLGVAVLDSSTGERLGYRVDERFAMTSTFKWVLVAAVLSRVDAGEESLDRAIRYDESDVLAYAPITRQHLAAGEMTVAELCDAAIRYSDNTAANLLLETLGGPEGLTEFMHSVGDDVSRLDRYEPALNTNHPDDERDTTTPSAMLGIMQTVLLGNTLSGPLKRLLHTWLIGNTTGDTKLRAGLDPDWIVGDKTGAGERGASNDVAIIWPEHGGPILIAAYYTDSTLPAATRNTVHAEIGRWVARAFRIRNN
ncbi:MAG: class A beta-lactamase [Marinobacter sp.]|uniref:class A beta-lactamase n=1 Tax=Marinobacter sp. TaxID=50741 RepID=UPI00299E7192|nr:class A beta-lactamase [Marinobacter sp.]MDX1757734.1 class A beta-lactamase [Marinobacter sp.]